jgi:hypothetical protein
MTPTGGKEFARTKAVKGLASGGLGDTTPTLNSVRIGSIRRP